MSTYHPIIPRADLPAPCPVSSPEIGIGLNEFSSQFSLMVVDRAVDLTAEQVLRMATEMVKAVSYSMDEAQFQKATTELWVNLSTAHEEVCTEDESTSPEPSVEEVKTVIHDALDRAVAPFLNTPTTLAVREQVVSGVTSALGLHSDDIRVDLDGAVIRISPRNMYAAVVMHLQHSPNVNRDFVEVFTATRVDGTQVFDLPSVQRYVLSPDPEHPDVLQAQVLPLLHRIQVECHEGTGPQGAEV